MSGKEIEYFLSKELYQSIEVELRTLIKAKKDIIPLLLKSTRLLLTNIQPNDKGYGSFSIKIEKMSRIFFEISHDNISKVFSFVFPFSIELVDQKKTNDVKKIIATSDRIELTSNIISFLLLLAEQDYFDESKPSIDLLELQCFIEENLEEFSILNPRGTEDIVKLVWELLIFEPSYIRYDIDPKTQGKNHPLHHFDCNYSNKGTFKIGLRKGLHTGQFEEFVNNNQRCYYLDYI